VNNYAYLGETVSSFVYSTYPQEEYTGPIISYPVLYSLLLEYTPA